MSQSGIYLFGGLCKKPQYALAGVPEYWIINPVDDYVLVLVLDTQTGAYSEVGEYRGNELIESALFPELQISAEALLDPD